MLSQDQDTGGCRHDEPICLFGINIHPSDLVTATKTIHGWLDSRVRPCRMIVTPNINHTVLFQDDAIFRQSYSRAALRLADGRYLSLFARILGLGTLPTVNGSDLVPALLAESSESENELRIFLLGAAPGVAERAAANIMNRYKSLHVVGTYSPPTGFEEILNESQKILDLIQAASPDLLIVGISPPRQEIWVAKHLEKLNAAVAICGGATIDFLAEQKSRAPAWLQKLGLEWGYRVFTEPARLAPRYLSDGLRILPLFWREWRKTRDQ